MKKPLIKTSRTNSSIKFDLKMKLSVLFIFSALLALQANDTYAQRTKITMDLSNVTVGQFLDKIENSTEYRFIYKIKEVDLNRTIKVYADKELIGSILQRVFKGSKTKYHIIKKRIYLTEEKGEKPYIDQVGVTSPPLPQFTVNGTVVDENGQPLPGATVLVKGTTNGTTTDFDGNYTLELEDQNAIIQVSYIGFALQEIPITGRTEIYVTMVPDTANLEEVVVTALGISRDKKSLGYSVSEVDHLEESGVYNVANALSGKVAGVNISAAASGVGGSSKVVIRGNNSLIGNGQPLYVVDGIPLNNDIRDEAGRWGGMDFGDGISGINQDDIESISVLKGPNAASLYGQRGSNGVILITTKSGKANQGLGIRYNSSLSIGEAAVLPDFQNVYGQGFNGDFTHYRANDGTIYNIADALSMGIQGTPKMSAGRNRLTRGSWGAAFDGRTYEDQFGNILPYVAQPHTYKDYFQTQIVRENSLSLDGGSENINYFLSYANFDVKGYVPTNKVSRNSYNVRVNANVTPKLNVDAKINFTMQKGENRPELSDGAANPAYLLISQPRSMPASTLEDYVWSEEQVALALGVGSRAKAGNEKTYATNGSTANQYWTVNKTFNSDEKNRILASLNIKYDFTDNFRVNLRGGTDTYTEQRYRYRDIGTRITSNQLGDMYEIVNRVQDNNFEALASWDIKSGDDWRFQINGGGSLQSKYFRSIGSEGLRFKVPDLFIVQNTEQINPIYDLRESEIQSVYGMAQVAFKEYFFLDLTGRNDWSSTLPVDNNSFFYPSASLSLLASEALGIRNNTLNFLKFRASIAQAGNSGDPYQLRGAYTVDNNTFLGRPTATFSNTIVDPNLKNELTSSYEFGMDLNMFSNRLGFNFTYYSASTKNQILTIPISQTTNYNFIRLNSGEITNKGIEFMISGTPISTSDGFTWESTFNFGKNKNEVVSLAEGIESFELGADRGISVRAIPRKAFGELYGTSFSWLKDDNGNILIDPDSGLPLRSEGKEPHRIGNAQPKWIGGFSNNFRFGNLSLTTLIDIRQGGQIYSQSTREEIIYGTTKRTLEGRNGTYIAKGVLAELNGDGDWVGTGVNNTIQVNAQDYWNVVASNKEDVISEEMLHDASYISMREITLGYQLPKKILNRTPFRNIGVSLFGRNLFYFQRNTDGFAPESSAFNVNNSSVGLESTSLPLMRTYGINFNLQF